MEQVWIRARKSGTNIRSLENKFQAQGLMRQFLEMFQVGSSLVIAVLQWKSSSSKQAQGYFLQAWPHLGPTYESSDLTRAQKIGSFQL